MKTREQIITDMCKKYRQDYDIIRDVNDPPWIQGMTESERSGLYETMSQIYDTCIKPLLEKEK